MADLYFKVNADYTELIKMRDEVRKFENQLRNLNLKITPRADVAKLEKDLQDAKTKLNDFTKQAALMAANLRMVNVSTATVGVGMVNVGKSARRASSGVRELNQSVGEMNSSFLGVSNGFQNFIRQFSLATLTVKGLQEALGLLKGALGTIMSFQSANATLQAILGASDEQMKGFKATAEELGRTTVFTAAQVTQLQTELSKLGFNEKNIHDMEESVLHFAQATGSELGNAASTAGAALRMFGVSESEYADQTVKFTNAMATATMRSALDFRSISENLATFGPMAHSIGLEIQDVLALFGTLKNAGVEASTAMTSLRNIFTKVSQGKIEGMGEVHSFEDFMKGLENIGNLDVGNGMKMIGPRGGTQFITLLQQATTKEGNKIRELQRQIVDGMNEDTTGGMAEKMTKNLAGSLKTLESAWQGFVLTFQESDGIIKDWVDTLAKGIGNLRELMAGSDDWSREQIENTAKIAAGITAMIAAIKTYTSFKQGSIGDSYEASLLKRQNAELLKSTAIENTRTNAVRATIEARRQELVMQRQAAVAAIEAQMSSAESVAINTKRTKVALLEKEIAENQKIVNQELAKLAIAEKQGSHADIVARQHTAEWYTDKARTLEEQRLVALKELEIEEDRILLANGKAQLTQDKLHVNTLEQGVGKMSKGKAVLDALGLGALTNPWVLLAAAITACGAAAYYFYTKMSDTEKVMESVHDKIADVNKEYREQVSNLKVNEHVLTKVDKKSALYKEKLEDLKAQTQKYGIELDVVKDKQGNEIIATEKLTEVHNQLAEAMRLENEERLRMEAMQTVNNSEAEKSKEAQKTFNEDVKGAGVTNAESVAAALQSSLTDNDIQLWGEYQVALLRVNELKKQGKTNTDEYRKAEEELKKAEKDRQELLKRMYSVVKQLYEAGIIEKDQVEDVQKAFGKMVKTMGEARGTTLFATGVIEEMSHANELLVDSNNKLTNSQKVTRKAAMLAGQQIDALQERIRDFANKHKDAIKIRFNIEVSENVPKWMEKELGIGDKGRNGGDLDKAKRLASSFQAMAENKNIEKNGYAIVGKGKDAKRMSYGEIVNRAAQYGNAVGQIQDNRIKYVEEAAKKAEEEASAKEQTANAQNERIRREEEERKYQELIKKIGEERKQTELDVENSITQARIDAMMNGEEKIRNQRELDRKKEKEQIVKGADDRLKKYIAQQKQIFDANPDNKKVTAKDKTKKGEARAGHAAAVFDEEAFKQTKEYLDYEAKVREETVYKMLASDQKYYEQSYSGYETMTQKKLSEEEKILADIANMREVQAKNLKIISGDYSSLAPEQQELFKSMDEKSLKAYMKQYQEINERLTANIMQAEIQMNQKRMESMNAYLKKYGTVEEQKLALTQEYNAKIAEAEGDMWKQMQLRKELDNQIKELDFKQIKEQMDWEEVFSDLNSHTKGYLQNLRAQLKELLEDPKLTIEEKKEIAVKLGEIDATIDDKGLFGTISETFAEHKRRVAEAENAVKAYNDALTEQSIAQMNLKMVANDIKDVLSGIGVNVKDEDLTYANKDKILASVDKEASPELYKKLEELFGKLGIAETKNKDKKDKTDKAETKKNKALDATIQNLRDKAKGMAETFDFVTMHLGGLNDLLGTIGLGNSGFGQFVSGMTQTAGNVKDAFSDFASGNFLGAAANGIKAIQSFGSTLGLSADGNASEVNSITEKNTRAIENLTSRIGNLTDKIDKSSGLQAIKYGNEAVKLQEEINRKAMETLDAQMGYHSAHHSNSSYLDDNYLKQLYQKEVSYAKAMGEDMFDSINFESDIYKMTPEQIAAIKMYMPETWEYLTTVGKYDKSEYWEAVVEQAGKLEELTTKVRDNLTGTTFDALKDSFRSAMTDLNSDATEFANNFEQMMYKAMVNAFVLDAKFDEWLKDWQKRYAEAVEANNTDLLNELNDEALRKREELVKQSAQYAQALGVEENANQKATANGIKNITADQADKLEGRLTAVQIAVENEVSQESQQNATLSNIHAFLNYSLTSLIDKSMVCNTTLESVQTILANSYLELLAIRQNTDDMLTPIKDMQRGISEMNTKLNKL